MAISENKTRMQISLGNDLTEKMDAFCSEAGLSRSSYIAGLIANDLYAKAAVINAAKELLAEASKE